MELGELTSVGWFFYVFVDEQVTLRPQNSNPFGKPTSCGPGPSKVKLQHDLGHCTPLGYHLLIAGAGTKPGWPRKMTELAGCSANLDFGGWDGKGKRIKTTSQRAMINVDPCHTAVAPVSERESHYVSSWSWSSGAIHIHKQLPSTALVILSSVTMLPYSNLCWTRTDRGSNPSGHRRSSVKVPLLGWKANTFLWLQSAT